MVGLELLPPMVPAEPAALAALLMVALVLLEQIMEIWAVVAPPQVRLVMAMTGATSTTVVARLQPAVAPVDQAETALTVPQEEPPEAAAVVAKNPVAVAALTEVVASAPTVK